MTSIVAAIDAEIAYRRERITEDYRRQARPRDAQNGRPSLAEVEG